MQIQSRRHAYIASLLRVRHVLVAVNKMDLIGYDEANFPLSSRIRFQSMCLTRSRPAPALSRIALCPRMSNAAKAISSQFADWARCHADVQVRHCWGCSKLCPPRSKLENVRHSPFSMQRCEFLARLHLPRIRRCRLRQAQSAVATRLPVFPQDEAREIRTHY